MKSKSASKTKKRKSQQDTSRSTEDVTTREKLLNSAEILFAKDGYEGTSTRAIADGADVPLGLMSYYFGTKKDLFAEVIRRRSAEHTKSILDSLDEVKERMAEETVPAKDIIRAFVEPVTQRLQSADAGWRAYIKLLASAANTPNTAPHARVFFKEYALVVEKFVELLKRKFPDAREEDIYWGFYLLNSAFTHVLVENQAIDRISNDRCKASDLEKVVEKLSIVFDAGLEKLAVS